MSWVHGAEQNQSNGFNQHKLGWEGCFGSPCTFLLLLQPCKATTGLHLPLVTSHRLSPHELHGTSPKEPPARARVPPSSSRCHGSMVPGCPCPMELSGSPEQALRELVGCGADGDAANCSRGGEGPSHPATNQPNAGPVCMWFHVQAQPEALALVLGA